MRDKKILIIDDETLIRRALSDYLQECGYLTAAAADGAEGLEMARAAHYDLVMADLRMPHVDGLKVIATLKVEQPRLPVVVVSGTGVLNDVVEAVRLGAWDYITKPIADMDEVTVVLERVMEKARLIAERDRYQNELEDLNRSLEAEVLRQTEDVRAQNRELAALNHVSRAISDPLNMETMLNRALDAAIAALQGDAGVVWLLNTVTGNLSISAAQGLPEPYLALFQTVALGQGIVGQVALQGLPRMKSSIPDKTAVGDTTASPFLSESDDPDMLILEKSLQMHGLHGTPSYICVPLRAAESDEEKPMLGALAVFVFEQRALSAHQVELLLNIGNQIGVAVTRAQYAADLKSANAKLERANAELRRLDVLREQFIQNVAHELRTPLALVRGYIEMLAQGSLAPQEQTLALSVTLRRVQALVELVEAITTLQDLNHKPLATQVIIPHELGMTACKMVAQRAQSTGVEIHLTCPQDLPAFSGDFYRLAQALYQLLDNACKFSPAKHPVHLQVWQPAQEDAICFSVIDHGIGIPTEERFRIFDRFYQIDGSTSRRYGGTGIGLALVKEIIEAHGGQVQLESQIGHGSTFTIWLPRTVRP